MCFGFIQSKAHDATEAFFSIYIQKESIKIDANFPWTIRKALLNFKPELEFNKTTENFEKAFFDYVKESLIIKDKYHSPLKLIEVIKSKDKGHSHETNYTFTFEKRDFYFITNQLMFNVSKKQNNHHYLFQGDYKIKFNTDKENPTFEIKNESNFNIFWIILSILIILIGGYLKLRKK